MPTLPTLFALILTGLRAAIAPIAARDRARTAILAHLWVRLGHLATRFERLYAQWRAGTLPTPRPPLPRPITPTKTATPERIRLPSAPAWLIRTTRETAPAASQLQHFLATADLAEFLAACPQAARLLRPLCRMLGIAPPPPQPPSPPKPSQADPQAERAPFAGLWRPTLSRADFSPA